MHQPALALLKQNFQVLGTQTGFRNSHRVRWHPEYCVQELRRRQFSSVAQSCLIFATPSTAACRPPCLSPTLRVYPNSCPLSQWCHPTISFSVVPFSSCLQSFPASGSFPMSQFFASGGQITGISASTSVLPINIQDWFPLGWTGWISLQSKALSRVFSNTTVQSINSSALSFLYSPTLTSIHDYWKTVALTRQTFVGFVIMSSF